MVNYGKTKLKHGWPKSVMVHYNIWYMPTQLKMQKINNVAFNIHQGLCHIMMFINDYVAFDVHEGSCHIAAWVKGYVALWQFPR